MEEEYYGQQYVAGFLFDETKTHVVLVLKNRPEWQAGKFNGVGGKVENELWHHAMRREFREETGLDVDNWKQFAQVAGPWGVVIFFKAFGDINSVRTMEDEEIWVWRVDEIPYDRCIPNLSWLVPLALYDHDNYLPVLARENNGRVAP